jgi:hypothetical protein
MEHFGISWGKRAKGMNAPGKVSVVLRWPQLQVRVHQESTKTANGSRCFHLAELQKKDDIFSGTNRASCVCQCTKGLGACASNFTNRVSYQTTIEIAKVSPTRTEGRAMVRPAGTKFDCKNGTYSIPPSEWQTFSWIPE